MARIILTHHGMRLSMQPAGMVPIVSYHTISQRYHPKTWATNRAGNPIQAHISTTPHVCQRKVLKTMSAWQTKKYGQIKNLTQTESARVPNLQRPDDVLVQVYSASVNPVDFKLLGGYGSKIFNQVRRAQGLLKNGSEFPLIPGRDFSGIVVDAGKQSTFKAGDEVWGALSVLRTRGSFAQYLVVPSSGVTSKPVSLTHLEAAAMPYVASTSWTALVSRAGLAAKTTQGKRVLILGGSGGVGSFAIQLMKAWGAEVTTTCSETAADLMASLGADIIVDYKRPSAFSDLESLRGYDVIFDCTGDDPEQYMKLLKKHANATYVTIVTPLMRNTDQFGILLGGLKSAITMAACTSMSMKEGRNYKWAYAEPNVTALKTVAALVEKGQIRPVIEDVFPFCEVDQALEKVSKGHNRGKTVIKVAQME